MHFADIKEKTFIKEYLGPALHSDNATKNLKILILDYGDADIATR